MGEERRKTGTVLRGVLPRLITRPAAAWAVVITAFALTAGAVSLVADRTRIETDLDEYMPQDHPAFVYSNEAEELFGIRDGIIIAIEHPQTIYNPGTLSKIGELTEALQSLEGIKPEDVASLATAENITAGGDELIVKPFYRKVPQTEAGLRLLREAVRGNGMIAGRMVSSDERSALVIAQIDDSGFSGEFYRRIGELARSLEGPETLHVAGRPIVEGTLAASGMQDMKRMAPLVIFVIIAVLLILLRSVKSTLLTFLTVVMSTAWTFGLMALLGIPVFAVSTMIPVMLIAIGVAYGIHLFNQLRLLRLAEPESSREDAVQRMFAAIWKPVLMAALTTAVGFVSLVTSEVFPVKYFGLFTAFGVISALVLSLLFIPAGLTILGLPRFRSAAGLKTGTPGREDTAWGMAGSFTRAVVRHRGLVLGITFAVLAVSALGIGRVRINSSFLENFEKESEIVRTDRFVNTHFGGTSTLNVVLEAEEDGTFTDPGVLRLMEALQRRAGENPLVGGSLSLADYLSRMNRVMHGDSAEYERTPESRELVAQYLLLYEMSGDPANLGRVTDYGYRTANITFQLKGDDSTTLAGVMDLAETFRDDFAGHGVTVHYAGSGYKSYIFTKLILEGQITSLLLSIGIVIVLISLMFRNLRVGLIGSVPIAVAAVVNFGVMGLLGIPLSVTTALISSIAVGIGIDYAIHFIDRYRDLSAGGEKLAVSVATMSRSGRAILYNAVVVIAGFLVLLGSAFPPNRSLGALVSFNMFTSFWGTVTVMFLLLYLSNLYFGRKTARGNGKTHNKE